MRLIAPLSVLAGGLVLVGCASTGAGTSTYAQDLAELRAECSERQGILTPNPNPSSDGRAATDYFCEIRGGGLPSDRIRRD